jgi:hypothetical protein
MITVTIWHNVAVDGQGRPTGILDGYQPGDTLVRGALNEVRTSEHGTRPLPAQGRDETTPSQPPAVSPWKEPNRP